MNSINIFGINIDRLSNESFLNFISKGIENNDRITIGYANADTLNKIYNNNDLRNIYNSFDLIHPDGIGVYLASRILFGKNGFDKRLTGSDFYPPLINKSINKKWSYFFFGHGYEILDEIKKKYPGLDVSGVNEGYNFNDQEVIEKINRANPDIIIIGLGCPIQEEWIFNNKEKIKFRVILAVGEGIRIFADKKIRGPQIFRKMGMEWMVRLILNPISNFRKYALGVPFFVFRILKTKFTQVDRFDI